ncbi:MAG: hypothetical protein WCO26_16290, partial [Deltaproteobacteria bacterium]
PSPGLDRAVGGVGAPRLDYSGGLVMERKGAARSAAPSSDQVKTLFVFQIKCPAAARLAAPHPVPRPVPRSIPVPSLTPSGLPPDLFFKIKKQIPNTSPGLKVSGLWQVGQVARPTSGCA